MSVEPCGRVHRAGGPRLGSCARARREMRKQERAYLYASAAVVMWSTSATAFKMALRYVDYLQLLFYSSLFSAVALAVVLAARRRMRDAFSGGPAGHLRSAGLGLLNPFLYYLVLFKAYDLLPAQMAQPLNYTWAIALALLSIPMLGQKIGPRAIAGGLVSYAGVWVISTKGELLAVRGSPLGVGLALASAFVWAFYWILNTKDDRDPTTRLFLNFLFGLPFVLAACAAFSDVRLHSWQAVAGVAYVGLIEMGIGFVMWLTALRLSVDTAKVGNLIFVAPFLSLALIHFVLGEHIVPSTFVGLALIVAGLAVHRLRAGRARVA